MQLRKLYRTIEAIASREFEKEEDLINHALHEIVQNNEIRIKGGRAWKFDTKTGTYVLIHQVGEIEKIKQHYQIKLKDYPIFLQLPSARTILAKETDDYLRKRGIHNYSATGIGEKILYRGKPLYKYVLAFNADYIDENLLATLNIISAALSTALKSKKIQKKAEQLEKDFDKAREIQRSILPQHELIFDKYEIYGVSIPDRIVGGDFFDYLQTEQDTERIGVVIGDAAHKGLSAAVHALYTAGAVRMGFEFQTKISFLLSRVNNLLHKTFPDDKFVSLFYAEITDDKNGLVLYANCGHNNPILYRKSTDTVEFLEPTGQLLGPFPNETFKTENILMQKGDILFLYTDGVSEAFDPNGNIYGEERIIRHLREHHFKNSKEITQQILNDVLLFNSGASNSDDKTIVTIKRVK